MTTKHQPSRERYPSIRIDRIRFEQLHRLTDQAIRLVRREVKDPVLNIPLAEIMRYAIDDFMAGHDPRAIAERFKFNNNMNEGDHE